MSESDSKLTIAWRYGKQTHANLGIADSDEFYYYSYSRSLKSKDILKEEDQESLEKGQTLPNLFTWGSQNEFKIETLIDSYSTQLLSEEDSTLARVIIPSLNINSLQKLQFLRDLKILTRSLNASTIVTIPKQFTPKKYMNCVMSLADSVIELTSFYNDELASTAYPGYDGALHLVKLPSLNTLNCLPLKIAQLGGRRVFIYKASLQRSLDVHMMHLQPQQQSTTEASSVACAPKVGGASLKPELQF